MTYYDKISREELAEKLFIISSEISMFMLFLKSYNNKASFDFGIELQKRIVSFKKVKDKYSSILDFKYWNGPQNVRNVMELIEFGKANTVEEAIEILNL